MNEVKIKLLSDSAKVPVKATEHSAGYDLFSNEDYLLGKNKFALISTGISIELPIGYEAQVRPRSGLAAKQGVTVLNAPGTIDADYRGEVKVILINHSDVDFEIKKGDRIAQMIISSVANADLIVTNDLTDTTRGTGGFGSTGK